MSLFRTLTNTKFPPTTISDNGIYIMRVIFNNLLCVSTMDIF